MSSSPLTPVTEIVVLREEVRVLSEKVDRLFEILEARVGGSGTSDWSGTLVSSAVPGAYAGSVVAAEPFVAGEHLLPVAPAASRVFVGAPSLTDRETICREIGAWLRRNLEGDHRGNSGRFRLPESSNFYVIIRDFTGQVYTSPVKVVQSFSQAKRLCCSSGIWGNSVFVGLPSVQDVRLCLEGGNFHCPPHLLDGRD